ncbi:MAG: sugar ABC transporter substrate-binding protein [Gemmatimonadales bacterium]
MARGPLLTRIAGAGLALGAMATIAAACTGSSASAGESELRVWAFGAEGEALAPMVSEFERANPGVHVRIQQIPWTAAHEKLLTAFVGGALPDVAQLGNTWIPEFAALDALAPLDSLVAGDSLAIPRADYFPGVWATNVVDGVLYGVPWYVDTRVLFYRTDLLRRAGVSSPPTTWQALRDAAVRVKRIQPAGAFPLLMPLDEWAQPVIFGLQQGAPLLADHGTRGDFRDPRFRRGFAFYVGLFADGLAPALANTQISNVYQEFEAGRVAMYITGPWNVGQFRARLPDSLQESWDTAPLPGPDSGGVSLAGGSSMVIMRRSPNRALAWRFVAFVSDPARQARFYEKTGDLPARRSAWATPALAHDPKLAAFRVQLGRVVPTPAVPEWELIASRVASAAERAARGRQTVDQALASLDAEVDAILEKRRWILSQRQGARP